MLLNEPHKFDHLLSADLSCLVQHDDRRRFHGLPSQEISECCQGRETFRGQIHGLLPLGSEGYNRMARFFEALDQGFEDKALARSGTAPKKCDEVTRSEQTD